MIDVRKELLALAEDGYRTFQMGLNPGKEPVLGVRAKPLRQLATRISKAEAPDYLAAAPGISLEEELLYGMVLGQAKVPLEDKLKHLKHFVARMDNWAVCDTLCYSFKDAKQHPEEVWAFTRPYFDLPGEYEIRFGCVMLLCYFLAHIGAQESLALLAGVHHEAYYARIATAWGLAECCAHHPQETLACLNTDAATPWVRRKAIQKIVESRKIAPEIHAQAKAIRALIPRQ